MSKAKAVRKLLQGKKRKASSKDSNLEEDETIELIGPLNPKSPEKDGENKRATRGSGISPIDYYEKFKYDGETYQLGDVIFFDNGHQSTLLPMKLTQIFKDEAERIRIGGTWLWLGDFEVKVGQKFQTFKEKFKMHDDEAFITDSFDILQLDNIRHKGVLMPEAEFFKKYPQGFIGTSRSKHFKQRSVRPIFCKRKYDSKIGKPLKSSVDPSWFMTGREFWIHFMNLKTTEKSNETNPAVTQKKKTSARKETTKKKMPINLDKSHDSDNNEDQGYEYESAASSEEDLSHIEEKESSASESEHGDDDDELITKVTVKKRKSPNKNVLTNKWSKRAQSVIKRYILCFLEHKHRIYVLTYIKD